MPLCLKLFFFTCAFLALGISSNIQSQASVSMQRIEEEQEVKKLQKEQQQNEVKSDAEVEAIRREREDRIQAEKKSKEQSKKIQKATRPSKGRR